MGLKYEMEEGLNLANAFGGTFVFFATAQSQTKKSKSIYPDTQSQRFGKSKRAKFHTAQNEISD